MKNIGIVGLTGLLALTAGALGQNWTEVGDAGDLPGTAQVVTGSGPLTSITTFLGTNDADVYRICINDEANFSATTVGGTTIDTQLFLFHADGRGVAMNDDAVGGTELQSRITSQFVTANGEYLLAIVRYDRDPRSAGGSMWNDTPFRSERAPDGPGAAGLLSGWEGSTTANTPAVMCFLTGACFIPTPASAALLGLAGLAGLRRRR